MREFDLIGLIRSNVGSRGAGISVGIGDDAAVLEIPAGRELVVSTDTLNEGVHFFAGTDAADIGYKALAVNLSDLAAMGAEPRWVLLSLSLPNGDRQFVESFVSGFLALAEQHRVSLVGGDTSSGHLSITVTALGLVEPGRALTRSGAGAGDLVVVSGCPGEAALALERLGRKATPHPSAARALLRPVPRIGLGAALVGKATACIDISDGLLADLGHVTHASGCGAVIELARLPCSEGLAACAKDERLHFQLAGGDDYELCFTLPPGEAGALAGLALDGGIGLTVIGRIEDRAGIRCLAPGGERYEAGTTGFEHFHE